MTQNAASTFLSVVIPAFNEEKNIRRGVLTVLSFLEKQPWESELLVVDDGSTDKTLEIVEGLARDHSNLRPIGRPHKGKGGTVAYGMRHAKGKYVLFADADLATPIEEVKRLLVWSEEHNFDIVIASREGLGAKREGEPMYRHIMGRVFNLLVRSITGLNFKDTQCGFKLFTKEASENIFSRLVIYAPDDGKTITKAFLGAFDVEVLVIAKKLKYTIKDVTVPWRYVETPRLRIIEDSLKMLRDVIRVKVNSVLGKYNSKEVKH